MDVRRVLYAWNICIVCVGLLLATAIPCLGLDRRPLAPVVDQVEVIEVSHVYNEAGEVIFSQFIFRDWSAWDATYPIVAWRIVKTTARPTYDAKRDLWTLVWTDGDVLRCVRARASYERWDQHDPELAERERFPKEYRRELTNPRPRVERSVLVRHDRHNP